MRYGKFAIIIFIMEDRKSNRYWNPKPSSTILPQSHFSLLIDPSQRSEGQSTAGTKEKLLNKECRYLIPVERNCLLNWGKILLICLTFSTQPQTQRFKIVSGNIRSKPSMSYLDELVIKNTWLRWRAALCTEYGSWLQQAAPGVGNRKLSWLNYS